MIGLRSPGKTVEELGLEPVSLARASDFHDAVFLAMFSLCS